MSKKGTTAKTLAKKLAKDETLKLAEKQLIGRSLEVADIEDSVKFFSPLQTRQQRKTRNRQLQKENLEQDCTEQQAPLESINENSNGWEPKYWRVALEHIRAMRSVVDAPVDTMGWHQCSDNEADEKTQRFQKFVALMLSSQTKGETTYEAMQHLNNMQVTPQVIVHIERSKLEELIKPVSFYKTKAKYLQLTSRILIEKYDSEVPNTMQELVALPGVGPRMAHIFMATVWNETTGIGVDTHVHRVANRLQWLPEPTEEPEQTRIALEAWLPRDLWQEVSHLMVGFGQTVCKAVRPQCVDCQNRFFCPASEYVKVSKNKSESLQNEYVSKLKSKELKNLYR